MTQEERIMAVDPGQKRIGLALSDPTMTIASPLCVLKHASLVVDAAQIRQMAEEYHVVLIVIGQALGADGEVTASSRHAGKLAAAIDAQKSIQVVLWDESGSTQTARKARIEMRANRERRSGHLDDLAATVILQNYLDERTNRNE